MSDTKSSPITANKAVLVGIVIGVFFVGIAIGYAIWANIYGPGIMLKENQQMSSLMMQSSELRQQMMQMTQGNMTGQGMMMGGK